MSSVLAIPMRVRLVRPGAVLPSYAHPGDSGLDLRMVAWRWPWDSPETARGGPIQLQSLQRVLVLTGIAVELPAGHEGQVRPRSGRTLREGLHVALGTIDNAYRGEVGVTLVNLTPAAVNIDPSDGRAIAQLVVAPVVTVRPVLALELTDTTRGDAGWGSSDAGQPRGAA